MISVPVPLGNDRYDVLVGEGARHELPGMLAAQLPGARQAVIVTQDLLTDTPWFADIDTGMPVHVVCIPDGEDAKTLGTVELICRELARSELTRDDAVVAVGGGLVTDVAGFAAAVYHRGMGYVNVATSLLAQVDAAIGGKTGVNLPEGKNLVGAFHQPSAVLCDTAVLATLPEREWKCGRGEMAKYAFLGKGQPDASILTRSLADQVATCVAVKADVVAADEKDRGRRMVLNYGHTLAHALEAAAFGTADAPRHGEAVAVGIVYAALLARRLGRIDDERVALHRKVVGGFGLGGALPHGVDPGVLVDFMTRDKKAQHDLTFVLDGPDGVEPVSGVHRGDVLATLAEMETGTAAQNISEGRNS